MPELPEVQTTVNGLSHTVVGLHIKDAWSDYDSMHIGASETIRSAKYFQGFRKRILGRKVMRVARRAKNILIYLDDDTVILVHMKMTGHLIYGTYDFRKPVTKLGRQSPWIPIAPESLKDPFNRHLHFVLTFTNGKRLALSDMRKFAKVTLVHADKLDVSKHIGKIGPEPMDDAFTFDRFLERIGRRPHGKIKLVLMDQVILAGIGNIYADESLWRAGIHPLSAVSKIPRYKARELFKAIKKTLSRGIDLGGDSMSDYRNIYGEKGKFQEQHRAYRKTGTRCSKPRCKGIITRIVVGGRGTHFCSVHQELFK